MSERVVYPDPIQIQRVHFKAKPPFPKISRIPEADFSTLSTSLRPWSKSADWKVKRKSRSGVIECSRGFSAQREGERLRAVVVST